MIQGVENRKQILRQGLVDQRRQMDAMLGAKQSFGK